MSKFGYDVWAERKYSFEFVRVTNNGFFEFAVADKKGSQFSLLCYEDGRIAYGQQIPRLGMTVRQKSGFEQALARFVLGCETPELEKARKDAAKRDYDRLKKSFLASADAMIRIGASAAEIRQMLDEHLVSHVMSS
jgi:hypothetical protein